MSQLGDNIRTIRKELGLTQQEFGKQLGVSRNAVWSYEIGRTEPDLYLLKVIARMSNYPVEIIQSDDIANFNDKTSKTIPTTETSRPVHFKDQVGLEEREKEIEDLRHIIALQKELLAELRRKKEGGP